MMLPRPEGVTSTTPCHLSRTRQRRECGIWARGDDSSLFSSPLRRCFPEDRFLAGTEPGQSLSGFSGERQTAGWNSRQSTRERGDRSSSNVKEQASLALTPPCSHLSPGPQCTSAPHWAAQARLCGHSYPESLSLPLAGISGPLRVGISACLIPPCLCL